MFIFFGIEFVYIMHITPAPVNLFWILTPFWTLCAAGPIFLSDVQWRVDAAAEWMIII